MARILVVNDETDLVDVCELVLEDAGHDVETMTQGRLAPAFARRTRPDMIVLDWLMNDTTGQEVFRDLRSDPATARIPVLMISAIPDGHVMARVYGLDAYLKKPFTGEALVRAVDRVLRSGADLKGSTARTQ